MSSATVAAESTRPALDNLDAIIGLLSGAALAEQEKDSVDSLKALEAASRALAAHVASRKSVETREFLAIERQIFILTRQAYTVSGFTRIRPGNCAKVNDALEAAINANAHLFKTGDSLIGSHFEAVLEAFSKTEVRTYPGEYQRTLLLHGRMKMLRGDSAGVLETIGFLADRPYAMELGFHEAFDILCLGLQAQSATGKVRNIATTAIAHALMLAEREPRHCLQIGSRLANFIAIGHMEPRQPLAIRYVQFLASRLAEARRKRGKKSTLFRADLAIWLSSRSLALTLFILQLVEARVTATREHALQNGSDVLVTRAMGGIGDLLMMTPGLRALSNTLGRPVKVAVPRKFFAVFENNPHVDVIDIEGPALNTASYRNWHNLTVCPAGIFETKHRPIVRKGRVEIFARAIGIKKSLLNQNGWSVEINPSPEVKAFVDTFLRKAKFGSRPLLGVQPYSRDSYKDHLKIRDIIEDLSRDYDLVLFHHRSDGLPSGLGIANTAGVSLEKSLGIVSRLDAMVSVDSAFLHAASAFDVPVVALFGPTDGNSFTLHHKRIKVLTMGKTFPCQPCWRNEDLPCYVTGTLGNSPCIAGISAADVRAAIAGLVSPAKSLSARDPH